MHDSRARSYPEGGRRRLERPAIVFGDVGGCLRNEKQRGVLHLWCDLLEHFEPFRRHGGTKLVKPVALPPGRARLSAKPLPTGSEIAVNTIGVVRLSRCRAATATELKAKIASG